MASFCSRDRDVRLPFFSQTSWSFDRKVRNQQNLVCYINILQFGPWKFSLLLQTHCISNEIDKHPGICQHINEMTTVKLCIVHSPLLTGPMVSRTSMSVMSSRAMVAVCGVPPARTWYNVEKSGPNQCAMLTEMGPLSIAIPVFSHWKGWAEHWQCRVIFRYQQMTLSVYGN
jgi:hypothetical protein